MKKRFMQFIACMFLIAYNIIGLAQEDRILDTKYYPASGEPKNVAIMLLGGSEGGMPTYSTESFTSRGYPCLMIAYFGTENTPDHLEMIPLEYFEDVIKMYKSKPEIRNKKIVVIGGSKGAELALLLASRYKQIEGVISKKPSSVVFQGIGGPSSSWSYKGEPVPFVPYAPYDYSKIVNNQYVEVYKLSLKQTKAVEKAAIKVENINGPILLISGKEDKMWPSTQMGDMVIKRLEEKKFPHWYRHFAYENAGHSLHENFLMGGTKDGNKKARIDSEQRIINFLNRLSRE